MSKVIELKGIYAKYNKKSDYILEDLNLDVESGEFIAIIGPSGVGKSTLFKVIVNALEISKGSVRLFGQNVYKTVKKDSNLTENKSEEAHISLEDWDTSRWALAYDNNKQKLADKLAKRQSCKNKKISYKKQKKSIMSRIGFLTQKPNLINTENVYNNITRSISQYKNWFYKLFSIITIEQKINIFTKLDELGILDKAFYKVSDLSGGQQQRVEIAKLLVKNVDLILADEPTSNLDRLTSLEVLSLLRKIANQGKTIIVNIHDLSLVKENFDRVIAIKNKTIVFDKKTNDVEQWELNSIIETKI
ncbi:ATP-binding cassette domain-containing protein [Mycoplasmopsis agalactiae]|uniref:ATP-binding cassette domain-containing protein n=1 Tax=Mycoplasmopsis agalactiae TaxID=2110 RepID=UPI001F89B24B|nr:ATP-binding cassette domain-containing protein [Mycoplasmopsis agalactiae]MCE6115146.1 ATP-binding cassette domain-containing protein [Mycoplasmopsis agalactiae]